MGLTNLKSPRTRKRAHSKIFNTTLASIPEIQACQYQLLLSISLPITTMEVEAGFTETRSIFSSEPHLAPGPSWSLDEIFDPNNFNYYEFSSWII